MKFVGGSLRHLDGLKSEALALSVFEDERPLRGAAGLVDWRLCGRLSALAVKRRLTGRLGEVVLIPARPRLPFEKLMLFGAGPSSGFDESAFCERVSQVLETLTRVRVRGSVMTLPGRSMHRIGAARAIELFLSVAERHPEHDEVTVIEDLDAQKEMQPIVERERRRARARYA
ncbi:MAG: leucyl aminopeptidase [Deltaproteobacteria bacterium]|nr:leucyl aminopeptidase [Deltaproteobacteria bacterium]